MKRCRRLATLGASLVLHGGILLTVLLAVSGESELGALFIDLTEGAVREAAGGKAGTPAAAGRGGTRPVRSIVAGRSASAPSAPPGAAAPPPAAEPASPRDPGVESPASPPQTSPEPPDASGADPAPRSAEPTDASPHGTWSDVPPLSPTGAPDGSVTQSGPDSGRGVGGGAPGGAPDVSRGFALAVAGGGAGGPGGPGAEYGAYLGRLRQRVQRALGYPLAARRRGLSGTVNVEIVIRADGAISAVAVADSSSHAVLDEAAVETIKRLAPEPFPRDVPPRTLRVRLPVVFALE